MRKQFLSLTLVSLLVSSLWSCNPAADEGTSQQGSNTTPEDTAELLMSKVEVDKAASIFKRQKDCLADLPADCKSSSAYCNTDSCTQKVVLCHTLTFDEFDELVQDWGTGKVRTKDEVLQVINGVNCETSRIRIRHRTIGGLTFDIEEISQAKKILSTSYYSIALFKGIIYRAEGAQPNIFTFYKGVKVNEDGSEGKIVPFKVEYENGTVGYYDLSDSLP